MSNFFLCASSIENQFRDDLQKWKKIVIIWLNFGILKIFDQQCLWTCLWHQSMLTESIKSG